MSSTDNPSVVIAVHGGAWAIPDSLAAASRQGVKIAARRGYLVLTERGSAVDAVVAAVTSLEDDPAFDAGTGSVLTSAGTVEMDAVVMEGRQLEAGAVACVHNVANPVQLARIVMEKTDHTLLVGEGADKFATEMQVPMKATDDLVTDMARQELQEYLKFDTTIHRSFKLRSPGSARDEHSHDTVGAVALDCHGNIACATSTGGITAKRPGRVGDSPIIGSGAYCDNSFGGVSTTGHGEAISKVCLAHHIISLMKQGSSAESAAEQGLAYMASRVGGSGGAIVVSPDGEVARSFSTKRMAWASVHGGVLKYGLEHDEELEETLNVTEQSHSNQTS